MPTYPRVTGQVDAGAFPDGEIEYADLSAAARSGLAAASEFTGSFGQLWATPAASTTLTGTLAAWTVTAVDCTAGAGARTLPAASSVAAGTAVSAKKADASSNTLVVSRAGSDLIFGTGSGATTKTLTLAGEAVEFVSNGVDKWTVRASDTPSGVLARTFATVPEPLRRTKVKLAQDPANFKMVVNGDSTSDAATSAYTIYGRLATLHLQPGEALYGVATDAYADGATTSGSPTFTSASAAFTSADVGRWITGTNIPAGTTISAFTNSTTVTLSANATSTGTGLSFQVGRHIIAGGNNGLALSVWMANPSGAYPYNRDKLLADAPDLIVPSWLINDIRLGALGTTVATIVPNAIALLTTYIQWVQTNLPNTDILLRMPNSLLSADVSSLHYVTDGATTNPAGQAQIYSTALRQAYLYFRGWGPGVDVIDMQARVFGTQSLASHPLMADQLHPTARTSSIGTTPYNGGYSAIADELAAYIGNRRSGPAVQQTIANYRYQREFLIAAGGSAFLDLTARDQKDADASQAPITTSDTLYVSGFDPISLSGKTISRPFGSTNIRITGLTGNDFTNYVGKLATVAGAHPGPTTGDRQIVSVDLPNVAAGTTATTTVAVTGARTGALHDATAVLCTPSAAFISGGLVLHGCYPSANDTVTVVVANPTGSDVDLAASNWAFWVVR